MAPTALDSLDRYCEARSQQMDDNEQQEPDAGLEARVVSALEETGVASDQVGEIVLHHLRDDANIRARILRGPDALTKEMTYVRSRAIEVNRGGLQAQVREVADLVGPLAMVDSLRPLCAPDLEPRLRP
ncbi:MAG: hypothetical protein WKF61_00465 [Luteimonas sp.]